MKRGQCEHGVFAKGCARCRKASEAPCSHNITGPCARCLEAQQPACGDQRPHAAHNGFAALCPRHDMTSDGTAPCLCEAPFWCTGVAS